MLPEQNIKMLQLNAGAEIILAENPRRIRKHFWRKPFGAGGSTWGGKSSGAVSPLSLFLSLPSCKLLQIGLKWSNVQHAAREEVHLRKSDPSVFVYWASEARWAGE